jgi:RHS repeat-associated protein
MGVPVTPEGTRSPIYLPLLHPPINYPIKMKTNFVSILLATVVVSAALSFPPLAPRAGAAETSAGTPPGWRGQGSAMLKGGPFKVRPASSSRGGTRKISPSTDGAALAPSALSSTSVQTSSVQTMSATASSDADFRTNELIALAAGLKNDRDLIFSWVRDHIRYVHYHGCKKGAHLTYLERSGNDIDQAALLVALWRAAGIDCQYVYGRIEMPVTAANQIDWYHYLGAEGSETGANGQLEQLVYSRGTPNGYFGVYPGSANNTRALSRMWVQVNVGGNWINYDPSFKLVQPVTPNLDLATAMGYSRSALLSSLGAGATGTNSITSLSYSGLGSYLGARVTQLLSALRNTYPGNSVEQTVGGWIPLPNATVASSSFPIAAAGYPWIPYDGYTYDVLPASLYATVQIQAPAVGLSWGPVNTASLRGQRLGLAFESGYAKLKIEDGQVASATSTVASGAALDVSVTITHAESAYVVTGVQVNQTATLASKGDGTYALVYGFDVTSEYLQTRQDQLDRYREAGVADSDQRMRLETLNVIGLNWLLQTELDHQLVATLKGQSPAYLHRFGRVAHELASGTDYSLYIDVPMNFSGFVSRATDLNSANRLTAEMTDSFIASAMEHGVLEQNQPATGSTVVSTTKILKMANDNATPVFLATDAATWSNVQPQLQYYSTANTSQMGNAITQGGQVLVPKTNSIPSGHWTGGGFAYSWLNSISMEQGMIIGGIYSGGYAGNYILNPASVPLTSIGAASSIRFNTALPTLPLTVGGDPVDLESGDFTHDRELLTAGSGLVRGLSFSVSYHGARRVKNEAKLGYGWTHSYYARATERADIEGAFGKKTPIEMATTLAGVVAALDLFAGRTGVKDWLGTALIANWTVDQLKGSGVALTMGDRIWDFHKQGDGTYSAPAGSTVSLTKDTVYHLTERNGPTWNFDTSNRLAQIVDLWGKTLTLAYNGNGDVQTVTDAYGRTLTFTYAGTGGALSSVSDNSTPARTAALSVDGTGNLLSIADPEGKQDQFQYFDFYGPHLVSGYLNHNGQYIVQNGFDRTGRVITQLTMGDSGKRWYYYYAPGVTIVSEPSGAQSADTTHYFDDRKREIQVVNALGEYLLTYFDGQNQVVGRERLVGDGLGNWPVDEVEYFGYDTSHNLLWSMDPQFNFVNNVYDAGNHLVSTTDKRNNIQYFQSYNAQHQPTQLVDRENRTVTLTYQPSTDPGAGEVATSTEGGFATSFHYDSKGALDLVTYPGGATAGRTNNYLGDAVTMTDELLRQTTITYNRRREVLTQVSPGTPANPTRTVTTTYDNQRNVATTQNPRGYITSFAYSVTRKLLTKTLPDNSVLTNHYNARDQVDWSKNQLNQQTSFGYDALGRTTSTTDPLSRTSTTVYEDAARRTTLQSPAPLNLQTKATLDSRGQLAVDEDGLAHTASPGYDANGNKTTWSDRRSKLWQFGFDKENRPTATQSPLGRTVSQTYDSRGLLQTVQEPSGQTATLGYDGRRRLTSRADAQGTINYTLDNAGQLTAVTEGTAVLQRTYHASGQVATYTNANSETISYDYDKNGNLISLTYPAIGSLPAATVTYTYDNRDRLSTVTDWNARTTTYTWDAAGRLTQVLRPNGTKRVLRWDAAGQLLSIEERATAGPPVAFRSFQYDSAGRLAKRVSFPQGNAWSEPAWTAAYDDDNRLTTLGGASLSYDADGNLLGSRLPDGPWGAAGSSTGASGVFTWNARNQLTRVVRSDNAQQIDYAYDAEGNLRTSTDSATGMTRWVTDPNGAAMTRTLARVAPNGDVTRYIYGAGLQYEVRADGTVRYYHYDQIGSTVALSDATGTVTGQADYTPYGALQSTSGELAAVGSTPFLFVGSYGVITDASTGLHQMRARWYSSHLRRFISEDPIGLAGGENSFGYCNGSPLMANDPDGEFVNFIIGAAIGIGVQATIDLIRGHRSSFGTYLGAAAGGALTGGLSSLVTGIGTAAVVGVVGSAGGNLIRQGTDIALGNQQSFSGTSLAVESAAGGVFGSLGQKVLPAALSTLSNATKGMIGEGISLVNNLAQGSIPIGRQVETALIGGRKTIADWEFQNLFTGATTLVESKFGTAGLTSAQRLARDTLGNYVVEKWTYGFLGQSGAAAGSILGAGGARALK